MSTAICFVLLAVPSAWARAQFNSEDFGQVTVNGSSPGTATLTFGGLISPPTFSLQHGLEFTIGTPICASNGMCTVSVTFSPKHAGVRRDALILKDGAGNLLVVTYLHGLGMAPQSAIFPGTIGTAAGTNRYGYSGDGALANAAELRLPQDVTVDQVGNVYIADTGNNVIRVIAAGTGIITTFAGNGTFGYSGDGGPAINAVLAAPTSVALDAEDNLYFSDFGNNVVRKVNAITGIIVTVAGGGSEPGNDGLGDGGPATSASLYGPSAVAIDTEGNLLIADAFHNLVRSVSPASGIITVIAGGGSDSGTDGFGDGGPPTSAQLNIPMDLAFDASGNLYIADAGNNLIRQIKNGIIIAIAGNGTPGYLGDDGPATSASFNAPSGVVLDAAGNIYVSDTNNLVIREIDAGTGIVRTLAGTGMPGYIGGGGTSTAAQLNYPFGMAFDAEANLYIADSANNSVRKVVMQPALITFSPTNVNDTSFPKLITVLNIGNQALNLGAVSLTANFRQQSSDGTDCSGSTILAAGASCRLAISFAPVATGDQSGTLSLVSDSLHVSGSSQIIALSGTTGSGPVAFRPSTLAFGNQNVGTTGPAQTINVSNSGNAPLSITSITVTGGNASDFNQASTCGVVGAGESCAIIVVFMASAEGPRSASISFADNATGSLHVVSLTGTGVPVGRVLLTPSLLNFGKQIVGSTVAQTINVLNSGSAPLWITTIAVTGENASDFSQTNSCGMIIAVGASCMISTTFSPQASGTRNAFLSISDSTGGSPHIVAMTGSGIRQSADGEKPGDVRVIGDFDGDGKLDYATWRPTNGTWYVQESSGAFLTQQWGLPGDIPVPGDYDGDGKTDYAVWRPSEGTWYIVPSASPRLPYSMQWGLPGDIPVVGDYDGDGKTDYAVWRSSNATWYFILSSDSTRRAYQWGLPDDVPVTGDFDGSGKQELAVWRRSTGVWYVVSWKTGRAFTQQWGESTDVPVPADYDGDGITDYAVWRPSNEDLYILPSANPSAPYTQQLSTPTDLLATKFSVGTLRSGVYVRVIGDFDGDGQVDFAAWRLNDATWFVVASSSPAIPLVQHWGQPSDVPVPADFDGDGKTDLAVWRPSDGTWRILPSSEPETDVVKPLGTAGDIPLVGDFDGDGKTDLAVWRPSDGTWCIIPSSTGLALQPEQWGLSGDIPVSGDFDGDGKTDLAVWRPSNGTWYVVRSSNPAIASTQQWGRPGDAAVAGDFDGDGKADYKIWRPATQSWFILPSVQASARIQAR